MSSTNGTKSPKTHLTAADVRRIYGGPVLGPMPEIEAALAIEEPEKPAGATRRALLDIASYATDALDGVISADVAGRGMAGVFDQLAKAQASKTPRFRFRSEAEILEAQPPLQLVDTVMACGGLASIAGPPGSGKTFFGIDIACSIRSGTPWVGGRQVHQGEVAYVIAEGSAALGPRIRAWSDYQLGGRPAGVSFLPQAVQLHEPRDVDDFVAAIRDQLPQPPVLTVFDTLARCAVGVEENSAKEMGLLIAAADRIREEVGSAVLLIHHMNANGERERGSTALRGAVDTFMTLKPSEEGYLVLKCEKQKDQAEFDDIELELTPFGSSVVLTARGSRAVVGHQLHAAELQTLRRLHEVEMPEGVSTSEWMAAANVLPRTFYKHRKTLYDNGFAERTKDGRYTRYVLSTKGREAIGA